KPNGHHRLAGGERSSAGVAVGEHDALRRRELDDFAQHFGSLWVADVDAAAGARIDSRAGAPPGSPSGGIGEESEDGFGGGADGDCAFDFMNWVRWLRCHLCPPVVNSLVLTSCRIGFGFVW